jgi:geranylgeranyl pyrophosphate synthase
MYTDSSPDRSAMVEHRIARLDGAPQGRPRLAARASMLEVLGRQAENLFAASLHPVVKGRMRERRWEDVLLSPVSDILGRPGKGIRGQLVDAGFVLVRPGERAPDAAVALVEILHAGSLVIDDIEDDSKTRRGGKAIHRVHGTAKALNAGNFMYFFALQQIEELSLAPASELRLHRMLTRTLLDCHRGQALDLGLRLGEVPQSEVPTVVAETSLLKTAALTALATGLGALVAGGTDEQVAALTAFGREWGLARQQLDDLGNLSGGGPPGRRYEDLRNGRLTWPWAWAAELLHPVDYQGFEAVAGALSRAGVGLRPNARALADALLRVAGEHRRKFILNRLRGLLGELAGSFARRGGTEGLFGLLALLDGRGG